MNLSLTPLVIWITGLPGAGKTTLANQIINYLKENSNKTFFHIDGDVIRRELYPEVGYKTDDRFFLSFQYQKLTKLLLDQNISVIISTVSMFEEIYSTNRKVFPNYVEIFLNPENTILTEGPRKEIYQLSQNNDINEFDDLYFPKFSDLYLVANSSDERQYWFDITVKYLKTKQVIL